MSDYRVATVEIAGIASTRVLAQYDAHDRWNGWLNPSLDALSVVQVLDALREDIERMPVDELGIEYVQMSYRFDDDATLIVDEDEDVTVRYEPDSDGLYELGSYAWTWSAAPVVQTFSVTCFCSNDALERLGGLDEHNRCPICSTQWK